MTGHHHRGSPDTVAVAAGPAGPARAPDLRRSCCTVEGARPATEPPRPVVPADVPARGDHRARRPAPDGPSASRAAHPPADDARNRRSEGGYARPCDRKWTVDLDGARVPVAGATGVPGGARTAEPAGRGARPALAGHGPAHRARAARAHPGAPHVVRDAYDPAARDRAVHDATAAPDGTPVAERCAG
ncbi:hypothetical protein ACF1AE_09420 [Streptomyces sp. NPDC014986]|uniref:hypothetical protein n=1 Tax=Streptomyces sp. NPDC014986 TaxID=3364934 RepID=UPI0036F5791D